MNSVDYWMEQVWKLGGAAAGEHGLVGKGGVLSIDLAFGNGLVVIEYELLP